MVGSVFSQNFLLKRKLNLKEMNRIAITDAIYGISAIAAAIFGLVLWFGVGKAADFYTNNWIFQLKVGLYILIALLSAIPTIFYLKNRKKLEEGDIINVPTKVTFIARLELILILILPLLALLMANGIGY